MDFQSCANCLRTLEDNSQLRACNEVLTTDIERRNAELVQSKQKIEKLTKDLAAIQVILNGAFESGEVSKKRILSAKPRKKPAQKLKSCECSGGCKNKRCGCFRMRLQCSNSCKCKCGKEQHQNGNVDKILPKAIKTEYPGSFLMWKKTKSFQNNKFIGKSFPIFQANSFQEKSLV